MTQPTALDVPSDTQSLLTRYVKETSALLGTALEGIVLYGSAVRGEFLPGRSNLNLLLCLASSDREILKRYANAQRRWSREQIVVPLMVTADEIQTSSTLFPLEYLEIQEQHRVLSGRDPFIGLHIDRSNLAIEVFQGVAGNLVRVRQRFVEGGATEEATTMLLPFSLTGLLPCLRGLQRLAGGTVMFNSDALIADIQRMAGCELPGIMDVLNLKRGKISPGPVEVPRLFERYVADLEKLFRYVCANGGAKSR
ncbi:MAG: hypothetical protein KF814_02755 [Nitrospiraceae bacterium]|nr:hypothetical protein [Nitrospiraceae bacterium]